MTFEKKYDPKTSEPALREFWETEKIYSFDPKSSKPIFSIDTPPPTLSGRMHIGHAFSYSQQDFLARYKRMKGFEVFYPFGTDDNGLATENLVQKQERVNLRSVSRREAIETAMSYIEKARPQFIQDWKNIGMSCDFDIIYSTLDDNSRKVSQKSFLDLVNKGLIIQKEGPVPWDRVFQTSIAQAELEDKEMKSTLNYVKAKIKGSENTYIVYATTRPELLFGCVGMSVEDEGEYVKLKVGDEYWITGANTYIEKFKDFQYEVVEQLQGQDFIGETAVIPLSNREVKIDHDVSVKADYGTGIVYFCTYGGVDCIEWMSRRPEREPITILEKNGKLNANNGKYEGMLANEARKAILDDLEESKDLIQKENIKHMVNVGERSGAEIEYIVSKQWYVKYLDKKEYFFEMANKFNWFPEHMKHRIENWIKGLNWDWGFSRQRHFGIPIPVWYDKEGKAYYADESQLPVDPTQDRPLGVPDDLELFPEEDVFDTWFTSASSPFLSTSLVDEETQKKLFPMDLRPQAHDIINFWLFYTMAKTNLLHDENPFKDVAISGWVLAPDGTKMSKSKGNTIAPQDVTEKYSNDAIRFGASASKLGSDQPFMEKEVQTGVKVANKLYNANKFASMLLEDFKPGKLENLTSIDKWILAKMQYVVKQADGHFAEYDYQKAKALYTDFFMNDVADNYIEIVKQRLWQKKEGFEAAQQTIYQVLYTALRGLAPIMPYITEEIYRVFYSNFEPEKSIHVTSYPEYDKQLADEEALEAGQLFVEIVKSVRKLKAERNLSMKEEVQAIKVTCSPELQVFIESSVEDLKAVTGAKDVQFAEGEFNVEFEL